MTNGLPAQRLVSALSWAFLLGVLGWAFLHWLQQGARAIAFPFELDYGEGIVWEQARRLFALEAYGPIDQFPSIVFHYPPVFHVASAALSHVFAADMLAVGRALSLVCTAGTAVLTGLLAADVMDARASRAARALAGLAATLSVFTWVPVLLWSPLMRVDMTAMLCAFLGVALGLRAIGDERLIYPAAASFVVAVYTKQTMIAAPLALFSVLLWARPRLAIRGMSVCLIAGLAALVGLTWATSGGFVRHVFLYNINRLDTARLAWIPVTLFYHPGYFVVALSALSGVPAIVRRYARLSALERAAAAAADSRPVSMLILVLYWALTALMSLAVAKSGASVNYLIEWTCVTSVFVGVALCQAARLMTERRLEPTRAALLTACLVPLALGAQVLVRHLLVPVSYERAWTAQRVAEDEELSARIRAADRPIISDNMVLLVRNGRPVLWEPAIFAELASVGMWDEEPLASRIRRGEFAMFITVDTRGTPVFDSRYNPRIADAMDAAYPVKKTLVAYTLHLPAPK